MSTKLRIQLVGYVIVGVYAVLMIAYGISVPSTVTRILSIVPTVLILLFWVFDTWAWRWPFIIRFTGRPWIGGTWAGVLKSYRRDESGAAVTSDHDVVLRVKQTFVSITLVMMTKESTSRSMAAMINTNDSGDYTLYYQYDNTPAILYRGSSTRHWGGVMADLHGSAPVEFKAEYWTSRETRGEFVLELVGRSHAAKFEEGQGMRNRGGGGR